MIFHSMRTPSVTALLARLPGEGEISGAGAAEHGVVHAVSHGAARTQDLPAAGIMAAAGQWPANHDDQVGVRVDEDLTGGRLAIFPGMLGDRAMTAGESQSAIHDEHDVLGEPFVRLDTEGRSPEVIDDVVGCVLGDAERSLMFLLLRRFDDPVSATPQPMGTAALHRWRS